MDASFQVTSASSQYPTRSKMDNIKFIEILNDFNTNINFTRYSVEEKMRFEESIEGEVKNENYTREEILNIVSQQKKNDEEKIKDGQKGKRWPIKKAVRFTN